MTTPVEGLGRRAVRGAAVTTASQAIRIALQIFSVVVLARLLTPEDYGLVAMVLTVVGVSEIFRDLGLSPAAIRAETLTRAERDNLFWLNTGLGAALMVVVAACAPLIVILYGRPELFTITLVLAPSYLLSGINTQYRVDLTRAMRFGTMAMIDLACAVVPLVVGIVAAAAGAHYWALVIQQLTSGVLGVVLTVGACRWLPRRYDRATPVGGFVRLGLAFVFGALMAYVSRNADSVLIGQRFGPDALGLYNRSVQLVRTPLNQLQTPFGTVALPVLAAAGDDDRRVMSAARRAHVAFSYPIVVGIAIVLGAPQAFVTLALGPRWISVADIMTFVAIAGGLSSVSYVTLWLFAARGLAKAMVRFNSISTVLALASLVVGANFGVVGVAAGMAVAAAISWPIALVYLSRYGTLPIAGLAWAGLRLIACTVVAVAAAREVIALTDIASPLAEATISGAVVLVVMAAASSVKQVRNDYIEIWKMIRLLRRSRSRPA